jgi:hypothetical protein
MSRIVSAITAAAAVVLLSPLTAAANDAPFPRLGGVNFGGSHDYDDPAYQAGLAKVDVSMLSIWPGWEKGRSMNMEQVVRNIKALNPNTKVFLYIVNNEMTNGTNNDAALKEWIDTLNAEHWWLYPAAATGSPVVSTFSSNHFILNNSSFGSRDANGDRLIEWYAKFAVERYYKPSPSIDGFMTDNVMWRPRVDGDWNRDGKLDSRNDPTVQSWVRQGLRQHFDMLKKLMPGKMQMGNISDWGLKEAVYPELTGVLQGGFLEALIGPSYAAESRGWSEMMSWYRKMMTPLLEPKLGIFHQIGVPTDYQAFRYGFASCLMDDGYYAFTDKAKGYDRVVWFDELDNKLGRATSPPQMKAWSKGVYRRDFENGIALVNPKGNGPVEVTVESGFKRISGKQVPAINSGQPVTTVKLSDRDGIILLRLKPVKSPAAPRNPRIG